MKYIKLFEENKFKVGDLVRIGWNGVLADGLEDKVFVISKVDYILGKLRYDTENIDPNDTDGWGWSKEEDLIPLPQWEVDAIKYNL